MSTDEQTSELSGATDAQFEIEGAVKAALKQIIDKIQQDIGDESRDGSLCVAETEETDKTKNRLFSG